MALEWHYLIDVRPTWNNAQQSANWEASVKRHISWIAKTTSGKVVLNAIRFHGKWVPISPYDGSLGKLNAWVDERGGKARDGKPYGAIVYYSPHVFQKFSPCHHPDPATNRGALADEILLHELVHAFRRVSGKRARVETSGGLLDYDSNEEFYAILVANIYVSDPTNRIKTDLRRDHHGFSAPDAGLADSFGFYESSRDAFDLVTKFTTDHPGLTRALANIPAPFNPLAAFFSDRPKAASLSRSANATIRDAVGWGTAFGRAARRELRKFVP